MKLPNILFILVDALRQDYAYHPGMKFIDFLLERKEGGSYIFHNHFSSNSWTFPCLGSLFTGMEPIHHQLWKIEYSTIEHWEDWGVPNIFTYLKKNFGYYTAWLGGAGFGGKEAGWGKLVNKKIDGLNLDNIQEGLKIIQKERKTPGFVYIHFLHPHEWFRKFEQRLRELRENPPPNEIEEWQAEYRKRLDELDDFLLNSPEMQNFIEWADMIILTADHGEGFRETPRDAIHTHSGDYYNPNVRRIPLVWWWKEFGERGAIVYKTRDLDIFPTLISMLKWKENPNNWKENCKYKPLKIDGISLFFYDMVKLLPSIHPKHPLASWETYCLISSDKKEDEKIKEKLKDLGYY